MVVHCKTNKIQVICPICKTRDIIGIPEREIKSNNNHLTTVSIQKGLICPHHFQVFVDKNFQVRGYQKVDLELNQENLIELRNGVKAFNQKEKENSNPFETINYDGNKANYESLNKTEIIKNMGLKLEANSNSKNKKMTLKDIYEEFWEFIDDNNVEFQEFVRIDPRRKKYLNKNNIIRSKERLISQPT